MNRVIITCLLSVLIWATLSAFDIVPPLVSYQGQVTDTQGNPVDATVDITFTIYANPNGTTPVWTETQTGVVVKEGLFTVLLGSVQPLRDTVFTAVGRYLGVRIGNDAEGLPLQRIVTVPFAHHVTTIGGAKGGPILGDVDATDTVSARVLQSGSSTTDGSLRILGNSSVGSFLLASEATTGGANLQLFDEDGTVTHSLQKDVSTGGGGYLSVARNGAGTSGFVVDGNSSSTEDTKVSILGGDRSMVFNTSVSGNSSVQLPSGSVDAVELSNEPGVAWNTQTSTNTYLPTGFVITMLTESIDCPSSGYVLVLGSAGLYIAHAAGSTDFVKLAVSSVDGVISNDQDFLESVDDAFPASGNRFVTTVHGLFPVSAGINTFYFLGNKTAGSGTAYVYDIQLTAVFIPTWYGSTPPATQAITDTLKQQIDALVASRVKEETQALKEQFQRELESIRSEWQAQSEKASGKD